MCVCVWHCAHTHTHSSRDRHSTLCAPPSSSSSYFHANWLKDVRLSTFFLLVRCWECSLGSWESVSISWSGWHGQLRRRKTKHPSIRQSVSHWAVTLKMMYHLFAGRLSHRSGSSPLSHSLYMLRQMTFALSLSTLLLLLALWPLLRRRRCVDLYLCEMFQAENCFMLDKDETKMMRPQLRWQQQQWQIDFLFSSSPFLPGS